MKLIKNNPKTSSKQGFTLLEISIVITIIALVIASIVAAVTLIRSTRVKSVISEVEVYKKAMVTFRDKYKALPGDMPNATDYWGTAASCSTYSNVPDTETCNGNGDGKITYASAETFTAWQQLTNAAMIPGSYTGNSTNVSYNVVDIGVNVPPSSIPGGGYFLYHITPRNTDGDLFAGNYGNIIVLGTKSEVVPYITNGAIMTPEEALGIDSKIDDGKPSYGRIMTTSSTYVHTTLCVTTPTATSSVYNTAYTRNACNMIFLTGL